METDEGEHERLIPFQLQFDKPLASQIKLAEWNPEKDLLAMVTEDSKVMLHRFNWQRLWTISPGKCILSICWRPDGKAIALGLEDGTVLLHNVENGKLLRSLKSHTAAVVSLNWEQDAQVQKNGSGNVLSFEDRTPRFFPAAPRVPSMPGLISGDAAMTDDGQDSFLELSNSSDQRFNILCSGDKDGSLCFSIFGIFPIGKLNIHSCKIPYMLEGNRIICRLLNASIGKVTLSKDLCHLIVTCLGELSEDNVESRDTQLAGHSIHGLHCLVLDTSIFQKRKNELHQVALQASNIEDLNEVVRTSLSVMRKQWSDAMSTFHEKFDSLSNLIINHGIDSSPQEELLSLLGGARTSPPVHQFLVNTLGEVAMKRVSKSVCSAGRELQLIVLNHLQPAVETIGFRLGELRGLSRWRARYQGIGLDEALTSSAAEKAGMLLIQVERFTRVLSSVVQQFANFFLWLLKCIKILMSEPSDQLSTYDSELVVVFLKYLYDQDPVKQLLEASEVDHEIEIDLETMQRVRKLIKLGGFADCEYLRRTLAKEFQQMEDSFKEAVEMPFSTISRKIICRSVVPLSPLAASPPTAAMLPVSVSYYETSKNSFGDYICFQIPDESFPDISNCVAMVRGSVSGPLQATLFSIPEGYRCVDLSLYKESQVVLLLNDDQSSSTGGGGGGGCMMIVEASELPFVEITGVNCWQLKEECMVQLEMENEKVRSIPHAVVPPLAVSASRGLACVFGAKKRALVYILEEDEDEATDAS